MIKTITYLGGGSLPGSELPSFAVSIASKKISAEMLSKIFRRAAVPVVPHIKDDEVILDMRTVFPEDVHYILEAVN